MSELVWSVKLSLLQNANVPDGDIRMDGVTVQADGFHFPSDTSRPRRFLGAVIVRGHRALPDITVQNPGLDDGDHVWIDATDGSRVRFAEIERWIESDGELHAEGTVLSTEGAAFLGDAYPAGTRLADPTVLG